MTGFSLDFAALARDYDSGARTPESVIEEVLARIAARGDDGVWITRVGREALLVAARAVTARRAAGETLPLYGLPFAVKDNIDVAGLPTTAACPAFAYTPAADAPVVARLRAAGAIVVGKANMDQFATGLVGVRSPYGVAQNAFDARYVPGGSSSGSAVAVAAGLVSFALGTDTAGSGRVPAAFNNVVGIKPSRGLLSAAGVVPACRSLDCVSIFALTCGDAAQVAEVARGDDDADPYAAGPARARAVSFRPAPPPARFRFAVPAGAPDALELCDDAQARAAFGAALRTAVALGGEPVPIDFTPFREAAALLYEGPFVAQRLEAAGRLLAELPGALLPPIRTILEGATRWDARAAFAAEARLRLLQRRAAAALAGADFLLVPTAPTIYTVEQVRQQPLTLNATLGTYVNFVNLLDLAAVAVPGPLRGDGLPAGVTLVGPWGSDGTLAGFAARLHAAAGVPMGATGHALPAAVGDDGNGNVVPVDPTWLPLAVVGAHLSGEPLNHQLTSVGGRPLRATRTAPAYRLFALPNTTPAKPGLVRVDRNGGGDGARIALEIWALPPEAFGAFVARVPAPLCIGSVELEDGSRVSGFLCEPHATAGARDISSYGGWRAWLSAARANGASAI